MEGNVGKCTLNLTHALDQKTAHAGVFVQFWMF
jgi:hypothetical protein